MVDRIWTLWSVLVNSHSRQAAHRYLRRQAIDPETRENKLDGGEYGHITWANTPPSREAKLSDIIDLGCAGEPIRIANIMDTLSGPF